MKNVILRPVTGDNIAAAFALEMCEEQRIFVSSPMRSLAMGYVYRDRCRAFGVYDSEQMAGYMMLRHDPEENAHTIWHFLIDRNFQGQGFGKAALREALAYIRSGEFGTSGRVLLTCNPRNEAALGLYHAFGFRETGRTEGIEIELELTL